MKGEYGQECNITACQKPNSATWFNHLNQKYYCPACANRLNNDEFNKRSVRELLGEGKQMCTEVIDHTIIEENEKQRGLNIVHVGDGGFKELEKQIMEASRKGEPMPIIGRVNSKNDDILRFGKQMYLDSDLVFTVTNPRHTEVPKKIERVPTEHEYAEYYLILKKQSKLSAKERKRIVELVESQK